MANILEQIRDQVNALSVDEVRAQLAKVQEQKAKQAERRKAKGSVELTDEQKAKRQEYNRQRMAKPEVKEKMKAYHAKPEVKERMKAYRVKRNERMKAILARAAELGITPESVGASPEQPGA